MAVSWAARSISGGEERVVSKGVADPSYLATVFVSHLSTVLCLALSVHLSSRLSIMSFLAGGGEGGGSRGYLRICQLLSCCLPKV